MITYNKNTYKLFYQDPYLKEWESIIEDVIENKDSFFIVLDKTAFYPEGGGQPSDIGYIDDIEVTHVFERNDIIYHVVNKKPENKKVKCKLDFDRRFNFMQQHSGEHLLSGVLYSLFKTNNDGFHMGEDYVTIDNTIANLTEEMILKVENLANKYIYDNIPIEDYIIQKDEVEKIDLRKECHVDKDIRIVQIQSVDKIACCGTHVRNTGEIGLIKIIKTEKYKGMTRIYFKCGRKALEDFQSKHNTVMTLTRCYSMMENEIVNKAKADIDEVKELSKQVKDLKESLYIYVAEQIVKENKKELIEIAFQDKSFEDIQIINRKILEKCKKVNILISEKENKLLFSNNLLEDLNCGKVFKEHLGKYNGRGGGGANQAQASFENKNDLLNFITFIKELVQQDN